MLVLRVVVSPVAPVKPQGFLLPQVSTIVDAIIVEHNFVYLSTIVGTKPEGARIIIGGG